MGHFRISLPGNRTGEVRWGKVIKISSLVRWLPWLNGNIDKKIGYFIRVEPAVEQKTEYRLFKTKEGNWFADEDGRLPITSETMLEIKDAIEAHEKLSRAT